MRARVIGIERLVVGSASASNVETQWAVRAAILEKYSGAPSGWGVAQSEAQADLAESETWVSQEKANHGIHGDTHHRSTAQLTPHRASNYYETGSDSGSASGSVSSSEGGVGAAETETEEGASLRNAPSFERALEVA